MGLNDTTSFSFATKASVLVVRDIPLLEWACLCNYVLVPIEKSYSKSLLERFEVWLQSVDEEGNNFIGVVCS
jgi:hypothetical protein